jgi:hypothetical protein
MAPNARQSPAPPAPLGVGRHLGEHCQEGAAAPRAATAARVRLRRGVCLRAGAAAARRRRHRGAARACHQHRESVFRAAAALALAGWLLLLLRLLLL